jgi:tight adherence protein C
MIVLMMILGVVLMSASAWLLLRASLVARLKMESHLSNIDGYKVGRVSAEVEVGGAGTPPAKPLAQFGARAGRFAARSMPWLPRMDRKELNAAGIYSLEPEVVDGYRLLAGGTMATVILLYAIVLTGGISALLVAVALGGALLGWNMPTQVIRRRGRNRLMQIDKRLPDLIDLLVASVEAGLGVGASMALLADRFDGPLGDELQLVLHQQRLGTSNSAALQAFAERSDTPAVRAFTRTLIRAEAMGGSVGTVLRNLAADSRRRRRQTARERAAKVPLKILFPLILLIFPSLFVVLLYPAAYSILHSFGG